jgi:class 3 adenylate cyclase
METIEPRERALDLFEAHGPIELKGVAYLVPLFRAAPS